MAEQGTFDKLVAEIGQALLPLREAVASPEAFVGLLNELGWTAAEPPAPLRALGTAVDTLFDSLRRLLGDGGLNEGAPGLRASVPAKSESAADVSADDAARVLAAVQGLVTAIRAIADAPDSAIPAHLRADGFRERFPRQLLDHLVITYLQRFHPSVGFGLRAFGIIKTAYVPPTGSRPSHTRMTLDVADVPKVLDDPSLVLQNAYGWGGPDLDFDELASQLDNLFLAMGFDVRIAALSDGAQTAVQGPRQDPLGPTATALTFAAFDQSVGGDEGEGRARGAVRLVRVPPAVTGGAPGLALLPSLTGSLGLRFELACGIAVTVRSALDLQGGVALLARPGEGVDVITGFESGGAPGHAKGAIEVTAESMAADGQPVLLLGTPDGTRLQFRALSGTGGVRIDGGQDDPVDVFAEFDLQGLEFVFKAGEDADGFLAAVLPADGFRIGGDLTLGVSHRDGLYFRGTSNLELQIPVGRRIGPVEVQSLSISVSPSGGAVPVGLGATFKAQLGPVTAVVDKVGLTALFEGRPGLDGNLGPLDVSLGFKPPGGAGLSIDTSVVRGGGFLAFDAARGEYAGAMELEFADFLALKAIGLVSTRMPDGSKGFSLLVVLTADFGEGIQLGYGFTLLAVGGLIGLNRGMNLQALAEGIRTGSIESVMFPRDVIANAPRVLSDLNAFFPPEQGTFLIGPMAKIGWATPTLVSISLGLIIEIPGDIAVLGTLRATLPNLKLPLLDLRVDFFGALEPGKNRLWFEARLVDSHVLTMPLDGGMGILVAWGDNPDLVLTVGGFHPSYKAPPLPFPVPERVSLDILHRDRQLIRISGYFAITSNTVQFGSKAELRLGFGSFGIEGHLSFDALFQFNPFRFDIAISASVSLKAFGVGVFSIDLRFRLEGPAPWRAHGRGSIGFLFFSISANFDITWGESLTTTLPPVLVLPLLAAELRKTEGWQTRLPTGSGKPLVSLRQLPPSDDLVLHPLGTLSVQQRALPLNVRLDRVGPRRTADGKRFTVAPAPGSGLVRVSDTGDKFAMAQYQDMSDAAKLSSPAYETQDTGLELTAAAGTLASARVVRRSARYELHILDSAPAANGARGAADADGPGTEPPARLSAGRTKRFHSVSPAVFDGLLQGSSTSRSPLSRREALLRQPFATADTVRVADQRFVVAYVRSNVPALPPRTLGRGAAGAPVDFRNQATAADALADFVAADPALDGLLHVIPASEAAVAPFVPGTWADTGTLPTPVAQVDSVLLATGKALLAGGTGAAGTAVAATALFDPTAGVWTASVAMAAARRLHTVTRLSDGRVLAAGGRGADGTPLASAEVFDPPAVAWTRSGPMGAARFAHSATRLSGGRVLAAGGSAARGGGQGFGALRSAELFDPATGAWTATAPMNDARTGHQAVLLRDGRVLVVGGALPTGGPGDAALAHCELYDPASGTWSPTGSLHTARTSHQATLLPDGRVLVTGGEAVVAADGTFDPRALASAESYDPLSGTWTPAVPMPGGRARHRALLTRAGDVLVIGGTTGPGRTAGFRSVLAYDPAAGAWTRIAGLSQGRWSTAVAELGDDRVLVTGGIAAAGAAAPGPGPLQLAATGEALIP
ncbi:kelch repeat-containing protein [Streptomyces atriruber]|uniref:kelch repeat-containing protein n=1 Tax=Streptomyces atriruber TaxID=545121 RepID=UPI0006E33521|nr:kelch repeat-containing protein [Streptomyces atriruber]